MPDEVPASLRQADANIYKTATRAVQLQSVKPIVAYWCDYWVLKQILSKGLHNGNPEILEYSGHLMDKLEQAKVEHATEDAILDDVAGQAYIEQFAQETLDRAQRVVKANKVTANTANTFDAAASFFGLVNIWGAPDQENLQKIKYAKWNATRILKAIKDGKDPNESNPQLDDLPQDPQESLEDALAGADPSQSHSLPAAAPHAVTVEDVPDRELPAPPADQPRRNSAGVSLPHSPASVASYHVAASAADLPSAGSLPILPTQPSGLPQTSPSAQPSAPPVVPAWQPAPPPLSSQPTFLPPSPQNLSSVPAPEPYYQPSPPPPSAYASTSIPPSAPQAQPPVSGYPPANSYRAQAAAAPPPAPPAAEVDDEAIVNAQKHAKWAISALNFEDVTTAVRELRKALEILGSS